MRGAPPTDEPPARVFRSLLALRPERPIGHRIRGAEDVPLRVRALGSLEQALLADEAAGGPPGIQERVFARLAIATCLWTAEGPAFASADAVGLLEQPELDALGADVFGALRRIAPTYSGGAVSAWEKILEAGAIVGPNLYETIALASCVDAGFSLIVARPDRYWGVPLHQLLDGHWMVYRAARVAMERLKGKK